MSLEWEQAIIDRDRRASGYENFLKANLPPPIMNDNKADWRQWPGTRRPGNPG
ncbi:MAG: hypothetical protein AAF480_19325 [Actinomycetota bacterium]